MFDITQSVQSEINTHTLSKALRNKPLALPTKDHQKLQEHLEACNCAVRPDSKLLAYVLANKLMNTRSGGDLHQSDLVVGGSRVTYTIDRGQPRMGVVQHDAKATQSSDIIPVASLLGATLIGMRVGQRGPLLFEEGTIARLTVIGVDNPI